MKARIDARLPRIPKRTFGLFLGIATALLPRAAGAATDGDLVVVLDASGSMRGKVSGETKVAGARRVLATLLDGLAAGRPVGLVAYGHRREGDCDDIELVAPLAPLRKESLVAAVNALQPKGKTPITGALKKAFATLEGRPAGGTVVLVTDGLETCGGDPCALVRAARAASAGFVVHVVGFDVAKEDVSSLECTAQAGGGLYLPAADAAELAAALTRTAAPGVAADGTLAVKAVADGALEDVVIRVVDASGKDVATGRTYRDAATNPRAIPLPAGPYQVDVEPVRIQGAPPRRLSVEVARGGRVEREVDYSTGELAVGVTRNGVLSDATFTIRAAGQRTSAAAGRTYRDARSNPAVERLVAGDYEVEVRSVEIEGSAPVSLGRVTVPPRGRARVDHAYASGTLRIGVRRSTALVDATLSVRDGRTEVARGRTYDRAASNPKTFVLVPGTYEVEVAEIKGTRRKVTVTVAAGKTEEQTVDLGR